MPLPMWKVWCEPWIDLEPGVFVQGHFGQGIIVKLSHADENFHYFICYAFNYGFIILVVPIEWQQEELIVPVRWWGKVLSKFRSFMSRIRI